MKKIGLLAATLALTLAAHAPAAVIAQWNFNSTTPDASTATGVTTPSVGSGTASLIGGVAGSFSNGDANGGSTDPAIGDDSGWQTTTYPTASANDLSAGTQYAVSTVGYKNIKVSYDLRHSNTSSRFEAIRYSLDGSTYTTQAFFTGATGDTWFNGRLADLSAVTAANNNPNFAVRIVSAFESTATGTGPSAYLGTQSTYAASGTWRFDMVTITGDPVPEPAALGLAGLTGLGLLCFRGKRK